MTDTRPSITCQVCGMTSHHPMDIAEGRLTLYPGDYDLCPEHYRTVTEVLRGSA